MNNFMNSIDKTLNGDTKFNVSVTENGAIGYRTSGKNLLDLNFKVSSLRNASEENVIKAFKLAFFEDKELALKWIFYARDVRGGLGERRLFRLVMHYLIKEYPEYAKKFLSYIPEYGRYDDLVDVIFDSDGDIDVPSDIVDIVKDIITKQLRQDITNMNKNNSISLLAKWLPSENASSIVTKRKAKNIINMLGLNERAYRKTLSKLRKYIDIVEAKMSAKEWADIKYENVPSRANLIYNNAFLRNDEARRREFLSKLERGEAKINATTLYPHDIVHKYTVYDFWHGYRTKPLDKTLEALWKALPENEIENTMVVADGSGSMNCRLSNTTVTAHDVSNALAIYFAEHSKGGFKDTFITFGHRPRLLNLSKANSLKEKIDITLSNTDYSDTNIEAVFDLILTTALDNNMTQDDMPKNILIISDMEFNGARFNFDKRLFKVIEEKFNANGYKLPRLIFWNVCGRTNTIPVIENDLGVALVSGFSTNIAKMIMSGETDPYKCLLEVLMSERYSSITIKE